MGKKVFTSQKLSLYFGAREIRVQALVSAYGAKYVFDDDDLPPEAPAYLGADVPMSYKGIPAMCRIVRETNSAGTIYNLRFLSPSGILLRQIERDVEAAGLPSPWMRGLPRLDTSAKHLPSPALAIVQHRAGTYYCNVRNFTLGGLLLEFGGVELRDVTVGTPFHFDLVTNGGDKLPGMEGAVTHVSAELNDRQPDQSRFYFGLKFVSLSLINETRYRTLIREHCVGLKEEASGV